MGKIPFPFGSFTEKVVQEHLNRQTAVPCRRSSGQIGTIILFHFAFEHCYIYIQIIMIELIIFSFESFPAIKFKRATTSSWKTTLSSLLAQLP